mgnify:CR=1 FL=1
MSDDHSGSGLFRRSYLRTSGAALAAATSLAGCSGGSAGGGDAATADRLGPVEVTKTRLRSVSSTHSPATQR